MPNVGDGYTVVSGSGTGGSLGAIHLFKDGADQGPVSLGHSTWPGVGAYFVREFDSTGTVYADSNTVVVAPTVTLGTLTLSGSLQIGVSASGTIIGANPGSTIAGNIPGISVNSGARTYSGTPTGSAGTISNGLVETLAGAVGSPKSSAITVAAASTVLNTLTLSGSLVNGTASSGTIVGASTGSTIVSNVSGLTVNSGARTYAWDGTGSAGTTSNGLVETLVGATGSPKSNSITVSPAPVGITAPVLTKTSGSGASPLLFSIGLDGTVAVGMYWRLMRTNAYTGSTSNPNWADVSAQTEERISSLEDFNGSVPFALLASEPNGYNAFRLQVYDDSGNTSAWSNVVFDTITAVVSTAKLATVNGVNKSGYIDVDAPTQLTATVNNHIGATVGVRTVTPIAAKTHFEGIVGSIGPSGLLEIGVCDSALDIGSLFTINAGNGSRKGCSIVLDSSTSFTSFANGGSTSGSKPVPATGHRVIVEIDPIGNTARFDYKNGGTITTLANITLTSNIPTNWTPYFAGALNDAPGDRWTAVFDPANFAVTPTAGYGFI